MIISGYSHNKSLGYENFFRILKYLVFAIAKQWRIGTISVLFYVSVPSDIFYPSRFSEFVNSLPRELLLRLKISLQS